MKRRATVSEADRGIGPSRIILVAEQARKEARRVNNPKHQKVVFPFPRIGIQTAGPPDLKSLSPGFVEVPCPRQQVRGKTPHLAWGHAILSVLGRPEAGGLCR